jgi:Protein of unknown function (DUF4242)
MQVFMVERSLKGISMEDLAAAQKRAIGMAAEMTGEGTSVRYIRSTFAPDSGRCMCLFEADDTGQVASLNKRANIPFDDIVAALDLTP